MSSGVVVVSTWIASSIVFSTAIILVLKQVGRSLSCNWTATVTTMHFFFTWVLLESMSMTGKIKQANNVPFLSVFVLSLLLVGAILLMNFNLVTNSIGFYQMSKLCCIPYVVLYTAVFEKKKYSWKEIASLALLLVGVALFSINDVEFNVKGSIVALFAIIASSHSQMRMGSIQHQYDIDGTTAQLLAAPIQVVLGTIACSILEFTGEKSFIQYEFRSLDWTLIIISCFLAVGVNVSGFGLIGQTSAVTYQVVGHVKTILLLIFGYIFFPSNWTSTGQIVKAILGIAIALVGVVLYSMVKLGQMKKPVEKNLEEEILVGDEKL